MGLILNTHKIIELDNICDIPTEGFQVRVEDLLPFEDDMIATWHTHPNQDSNLSVNDYRTFLNYPDLRHYIVGTDGVAEYTVENGKVMRCDD